VTFTYENRKDSVMEYFGGCKIQTTQRMTGIISKVQNQLVHQYRLQYTDSPLTKLSRLQSITLEDPDKNYVSPLRFDWYNGNVNVFDDIKLVGNLSAGGTDVQIIPIDVNANGTSDVVVTSKKYDPTLGADGLYLDVYYVNHKGEMNATPAGGNGFTGLPFSSIFLPLDVDGNGKTDFVCFYLLKCGINLK
jgi:hypothetical protein